MPVKQILGDIRLMNTERAKPSHGGHQQPQNKPTNMSVEQKKGDFQSMKHRRGQTQLWWPPAATEQTNKHGCRKTSDLLMIDKTQKRPNPVMVDTSGHRTNQQKRLQEKTWVTSNYYNTEGAKPSHGSYIHILTYMYIYTYI